MKLRIRSTDTNETIRVEIDNTASIDDLKSLLVSKIPSMATVSLESIRLSLNRADELVGAGDETLTAIGLTSGDLVYFSVHFLDQNQNSSSGIQSDETQVDRSSGNSKIGDLEKTLVSNRQTLSESSTVSAVKVNSDVAPEPMDETEGPEQLKVPEVSPGTIVAATQHDLRGLDVTGGVMEPMNGIKDSGDEASCSGGDSMDVYEEAAVLGKSPSVPGVLKRVLEVEMASASSAVEYSVIAVHAVLLESGFVTCGGNGTRLPEGWASSQVNISLTYTIPELMGGHIEKNAKVATLKFSVMQNYAFIYGFVREACHGVYHVTLNAEKLVSQLVSSLDVMSEVEEKDVFQFWKNVKDELALPLMIDICEKNGLPLPACFTRLPTELKLKILELLRGADLLSMGCTCSELRYLSSSEELWKRKFEEEFGLLLMEDVQRNMHARGSWRSKFLRYWKEKKDRERIRFKEPFPNLLFVPPRHNVRFPYGSGRLPVIGGDYDLYPSIGPFGSAAQITRLTQSPSYRRNYSPQCNFRRYGFP